MNLATKQRDSVARLAKTDWNRALGMARDIVDPWFRAQAISHVVRYCDAKPKSIADEAAEAAESCADPYQQCAVRAWEIAALAERSEVKVAFNRLHSVLSQCDDITPCSSRSEALSLLLHAAARIDTHAPSLVAEKLVHVANGDSHWRCQRAAVDGLGVLSRIDKDAALGLLQSLVDPKLKSKCERTITEGGTSPREFFW